MPIKLGSNEVKSRALAFSQKWATETRERAEASTFWNEFFTIFGIERRRLASFEAPVKQRKEGGKTTTGFIDLFWKGTLIVEHKSAGKNLDRAYQQAIDYFPEIAEQDLPRYILVSDFQRFRLFDLDTNVASEFELSKLHENIRLFDFIRGVQTTVFKEQDPANIEAAERMGRLHDQLRAIGYSGHDLERYLVRLLFCLFAEDTSIFEPRQFQDYIEQQTCADGVDLAPKLDELFYVLNTPETRRLKIMDDALRAFPYVNGALFEERLAPASFDTKMRNTLLFACSLDWSRISPAIFGALFQSIMDEKARRNLGAHYTSEKNILKLIGPLFLDELKTEFARCGTNRARLADFHSKIARLKFLDPACGCGNFLVITYREIRLLELAVLKLLFAKELKSGQETDIELLVQCDVDQFYGIEIEEFPAQIAQVAMWLTDHQMNLVCSEAFGQYFRRLPLKKSAKIVHGNALRMDWADVVEKSRLSYILGNPPFVGAKFMSAEQRADMTAIFHGVKSAGLLDYVTAWYFKAAQIATGTNIACAFVSTNSISQGEQPGVFWPELWRLGMRIQFAHRTFSWRNEAKGVAAVHCVIIGLSRRTDLKLRLFDYDDTRGEPTENTASNISPYLIDAADIVLSGRTLPICKVPAMQSGNKPIDDGNFLFTPEQRLDFIKHEPAAEKFFRKWLGGEEFINNIERWYLYLADCSPQELRALPNVQARIHAVKKFRAASISPQTQAIANTPTKFHTTFLANSDYIALPEVSSERRRFIPINFLPRKTLVGNKLRVVDKGNLYHFGILTSTMHMAWVKTVTGRLKSDFQYSVKIVYNNYPWPEAPTKTQKSAIEAAAQTVLNMRAKFPDASLADLYDPLTTPPALSKAHQQLDKAVDAAYDFKGKTDAERVAFLFGLYQKYTSLLPVAKARKSALKIIQKAAPNI